MDKNIMYDITAGMYILTTKDSGCFVDAVMQISSENEPKVCVSVMKSNYTNEVMHKEKYFAISIFGKSSNTELIKTFGMNSSRDINKFEGLDLINIDGINIIKDSIGYLYLEKVDMIENDTHTLFIGKVITKERFNTDEIMTYQYYQDHKEEILKIKTESGKTAWVCQVCGYIYYGEELPNDFVCPACKMPSSVFKKVED